MVERGTVLTSLALLCGLVAVASAQPKKTPLVPIGANQIMKITPAAGFIDDVVAYDRQRIAYVVADGTTKAELRIVQLGCTKCIEAGQEIVADLSSITLRPTSLHLVRGQRAFVIGATADGNQVAALVRLGSTSPAPIYKLGPAQHISVVSRDGARRVAVHAVTPTKTGTRHQVELFAIESGKRVARGKPFDLVGDRHEKLDFRVNHWSDGWTRASGLKGGVWSKKTDTRSPDTEATYDLVTGRFVEDKAITDVIEQRKRYQVLADAGGTLDFLRMTWDLSAIELWHRGTARTLELDQPITTYDPKSLQGVIGPDGSAWIALEVDPVNPAAVARKKADIEYLDVFRVGPGETRAVRKARIPAKDLRFRFGTIDGYFWLLERSSGFDRGGRSITVYQVAP